MALSDVTHLYISFTNASSKKGRERKRDGEKEKEKKRKEQKSKRGRRGIKKSEWKEDKITRDLAASMLSFRYRNRLPSRDTLSRIKCQLPR